MPIKNLKNKVALVTGGSRGIGAAIARKFSALGMTIAITHRKRMGQSEKRALELQEEIFTLGGKAMKFQCDISKKSQVIELIEQVKSNFGRLDILVLNAARAPFKPIEKLLHRELNELVNINFLGNIFCIQASLPLLEKASGKIVFISSLGSRFYNPSYPLGSMKSAMETVVRDCSRSLREKGVSVNGVCGGLVKTDSFKAMRFYWQGLETIPEHLFVTPEEIASVVAFLSDSESSGISGQTLVVDKGFSNALFGFFEP